MLEERWAYPRPCDNPKELRSNRPLPPPSRCSDGIWNPLYTRASTSDALWPPKPKLLLMATSTFASRATFGV
jgi:hypothetical protein